jgi:UDP-glucose 4-epimerase
MRGACHKPTRDPPLDVDAGRWSADGLQTEGAVLVTGGAGYIGSHAVLALREAGFDVVVLDDLSTGRAEAVPEGVPLEVGNVGDAPRLAELIRRHRVRSVLHFAGSIVVPESIERPLDYYQNNTGNSLVLMRACHEAGVDHFVFSSSAAVYGEPDEVPVDESAPCRPINPYGWSKRMTEQMLIDAAASSSLRPVMLRYFNVAGADPAGRTGQSTPKATHLVKVASEAALGLRPQLQIFGTDYPTPDGTCVRDYIHVTDLADAHVLALRHLLGGGEPLILNCGYGRGYSVREVVAAVERAIDAPLPVREQGRRAGDPACLVASAERIRRVLRWQPKHDCLDSIVETALAWERLRMTS